MHNTVPQLGKWNSSLGCMVYDETPQMGGLDGTGIKWLDNIIGSGKQAVNATVDAQKDKLATQIKSIIPNAKDKFIQDFLNTPTGQSMVEDAKQGWFDQQKAKVYEAYLSGQATAMEYLRLYKTQIMIGVAVIGLAGLGYVVYKRSRKAPRMAAANPRRRRKYKKLHRRRK